MNEQRSKADSLLRQGENFLQTSDYANALACYQQCFEIARQVEHADIAILSLWGLGATYSRLGEFERALEYHQYALKFAGGMDNPAYMGGLFIELGNDYTILGNYDKALEYYKKSMAIAKRINDRSLEMNAWGSMGLAYENLKDIEKAIDCTQNALKIAHELDENFAEGKSYGNIGGFYFQLGDYNRAEEYARKSLELFRKVRARFEEGGALSNIANAMRRSGNYAAAEKYLHEAIDLLEKTRSELNELAFQKATFFEMQVRTYKLLQQVLIAQEKELEALLAAEQGRSRTLIELVAQSFEVSRLEIQNTTSVDELLHIAKTQAATIVEYSIIYDDFFGEGDSISHQTALFIWVVRPDGRVAYREVDLKYLWQTQNTTLTGLILRAREAITAPKVSRKIRQADQNVEIANPLPDGLQQLFHLLIRPIVDLLPSSVDDRIIFVPDGALHYVPFAALKDGDQYLIEKHTIVMSPSIRILDITHRRKKDISESSPKKALVVGNPSMPQGFGELPDSEQEATEIAQLLGVHAFVGQEATKAAVKSAMVGARFIHLATHGLLDDVWKEGKVPGAIILAPSETDDGVLSSDEIARLKLNAELVVLSACSTGLGKVLSEGLMGLPRAWIVSGVPSVIVSLWPVSDISTRFMMTNFYHLLRTYDKAESLRRAILATKAQFPEPEDWASFVLIGESE